MPYKYPTPPSSFPLTLPSPSCPQAASIARRSCHFRHRTSSIPAASVSPCTRDHVHRRPLLVAHLRDPFSFCFMQRGKRPTKLNGVRRGNPGAHRSSSPPAMPRPSSFSPRHAASPGDLPELEGLLNLHETSPPTRSTTTAPPFSGDLGEPRNTPYVIREPLSVTNP